MTIRRKILTTIMAGATLGALSGTAMAADIIDPPIIEAPVIEKVKPFGGWYIRGDVGYSFNKERGKSVFEGDFFDGAVDGNQPPVPIGGSADPIKFANEYDDSYSVGVGVGAHMGQYLRGDITADFLFNGHYGSGDAGADRGCDPDAGACKFGFESDFDALTVLANAYVDFGTFAGITPYVGAGIGFAHIDYGDVTGATCSGSGLGEACGINGTSAETSTVEGDSSLRLAWSLAAGASYDVGHNFAIDAGYRFTRIEDGQVIHTGSNSLKDDGIDMHQVRVGARYKLH